MNIYLKIFVKLCFIISLVLSLNLLYFIYANNPPAKITVGKLEEGQVIKEMDRDVENYNCKKFTDIVQGVLTYCERKKALPLEIGVPMVRGYFILDTNTIWIDKDVPNDTILHELFHWADMHFANQDLETRAYAFQEMYSQLVSEKIIK